MPPSRIFPLLFDRARAWPFRFPFSAPHAQFSKATIHGSALLFFPFFPLANFQERFLVHLTSTRRRPARYPLVFRGLLRGAAKVSSFFPSITVRSPRELFFLSPRPVSRCLDPPFPLFEPSRPSSPEFAALYPLISVHAATPGSLFSSSSRVATADANSHSFRAA